VYLSRLILDPRSRDVRRDLADCHSMHRTLMMSFPNSRGHHVSPRAHYGLLFRVEFDKRTQLPIIYAHSRKKPDWTLLPEGYLATDPARRENPACKDVDHAYSAIYEGQMLAFTLKANPTRKIGTTLKTERLSDTPKSNGRRVYLAREDEQLEWLTRKGEQHGFRILAAGFSSQVLDATVDSQGIVRGRKQIGDEKSFAELTFRGCTFRGRLQVTDKCKFIDALATGIGSGKSFGFGMLSIAPAR